MAHVLQHVLFIVLFVLQALPLPGVARLASGCSAGSIKLWDVAVASNGEALASVDAAPGSGVRAMVSLPDSQLASGSTDGSVTIWRAGTKAAAAAAHRSWPG